MSSHSLELPQLAELELPSGLTSLCLVGSSPPRPAVLLGTPRSCGAGLTPSGQTRNCPEGLELDLSEESGRTGAEAPGRLGPGRSGGGGLGEEDKGARAPEGTPPLVWEQPGL